jgi:hypothetical protein
MRARNPVRDFLVVAAVLLILGFCGIVALRLLFSRTREFRAQARVGQPIVRAIQDFRKQTGSYPISLAELAPKYLPTVPDIQQDEHYKYGSWEYHVVTNGAVVSYSLRSYMGRGGVEYQPPNWIGNDEGSRAIILSDE